MPAGRVPKWLEAKDPGLVAVKRSARVSLATCIGFYFSRYVLDDPQMATFASFGCIALGALSEVTGKPWQRTRAYAIALLAGMILITTGTLLAVNTWAAAAGMLVVGFLIAYAGVGGPRVVGAATGLQLLYILPSFPPYAPEALGSRLIGVTIGIGLLAIADRVLWPPPVPTPFGHRLADVVQAVRARLLAVLDGNEQPAAQSNVASSLRLNSIPPLQRPTGPGRRDRAAMQASTLLRGVEARVAALEGLTNHDYPAASHHVAARLLDVTARSLGTSAKALQDGPSPDPTEVEAALSGYVHGRQSLVGVAEIDHNVQIRLRIAVVVEELAVWTRDLAVATKIIRGERVPAPATRSIAEPFWYAYRSALVLWFVRFRGHFTPRSVFFQNAVRLGLGLAVARVVAGELDLSHGFWVLLATLTLMRTSAVATRAALVPAFLGTVAGGLAAAVILALAGANSVVYEVVFPFVLVVALAAGPILGPAVGQATFTLVVAFLFAQMAPVSWRLAEVRITDVVLGGLLGAVIGLLVWPRGATGEMRRAAKVTLDIAADDLQATVRSLTHSAAPEGNSTDVDSVATHFQILADSTFAQYRSELRSSPDNVDWLAVLGLANEAVRGGQALRRTHGAAGPLPWPRVADDLEKLAADTADQLREVADLVSSRTAESQAAPRVDGFSVDSWLVTSEAREVAHRDADPASSIRVLDIWGWLAGMSFDSRRTAASVTSAADSSSR
jgi:uncharacterized membrane protein YccC